MCQLILTISNHGYTALKYTSEINGFWINFFHLFPFHYKAVCNRIHEFPSNGGRINSIKYFYINGLASQQLSNPEERDSWSSARGDNQNWFFFWENLQRLNGIDNQCFDAAIARIITRIHTFSLQQTSCVFLIKCDPKAVFILPERLQHI